MELPKRFRNFITAHHHHGTFAVVATAFDENRKALAEPVQRYSREPELAAVLALGDLERVLKDKDWRIMEISIVRE